MDLIAVISRRQNMNLDKITDISKISEEIEKYRTMLMEYKKRGATERQLTNLRDKIQELVIEKQKIEVLTELLNQDYLVKTAYGKKRQSEIYSTLLKRYSSGQLDLVKFKEILQDLSVTLKSKTDDRTETKRLEDFFSGLF
jgi:GTPase involved in cell partitioning and DNA repair